MTQKSPSGLLLAAGSVLPALPSATPCIGKRLARSEGRLGGEPSALGPDPTPAQALWAQLLPPVLFHTGLLASLSSQEGRGDTVLRMLRAEAGGPLRSRLSKPRGAGRPLAQSPGPLQGPSQPEGRGWGPLKNDTQTRPGSKRQSHVWPAPGGEQAQEVSRSLAPL